ncbi:DUF2790 domain-containing protein [Pseudomonas sp. CrR25]|nr:DUF2790 domain-containing protein [Pseudomonas sp. CrR25]
MKTILFSVLGLLMTAQAVAGNQKEPSTTDTAVVYRYGIHLDIARVIAHSEIPPVCQAVPVQMTYDDSNGERHTIRYRVMGSGCQSG